MKHEPGNLLKMLFFILRREGGIYYIIFNNKLNFNPFGLKFFIIYDTSIINEKLLVFM